MVVGLLGSDFINMSDTTTQHSTVILKIGKGDITHAYWSACSSQHELYFKRIRYIRKISGNGITHTGNDLNAENIFICARTNIAGTFPQFQ